MSVRIAVVQQDHNPGGVTENRRKALASAQEALSKGADAILFHEELLVGYADDPRSLAEPVSGTTTNLFQQVLQGSSSQVIYGLTERDGDSCYISAAVVGAEGLKAHYRKTHLWWDATGPRYEPAIYRPGDHWTTFGVGGFTAGVMICYDGDFLETTRSYANLGCSLLFWMNNRGSRGYEETRQKAELNSIILATSCCCGTNERGEACRGGSNIVDADGRLLVELWDREGIIYADVEPGKVMELRRRNFNFVGQRQDLYR
jgi:predicted amidohydrolase